MYPYNNYIQDFADNQEDVMFVPMPKCPEADEYYLPARVSGFSLIKGAKNPKGVAAYLNCAMATRDSEAAVEIGKRQAFEEHNWTQEQWDMYRLVNQMTAEHPVIEMYNAVNSNVADLINNPMKEGYNSGASWTQTVKLSALQSRRNLIRLTKSLPKRADDPSIIKDDPSIIK